MENSEDFEAFPPGYSTSSRAVVPVEATIIFHFLIRRDSMKIRHLFAAFGWAMILLGLTLALPHLGAQSLAAQGGEPDTAQDDEDERAPTGTAAVPRPSHPAADIAVTETADELNNDGDCSLREAVQAANTDAAVDACTAGAGADVIYVPAGFYLLSLVGAGEDANATGDLDISSDLTLLGDGPPNTYIDGFNADRVLHVTTVSMTVNIANLTVQFGNTPSQGGGLMARGTVNVSNSVFYGNTANTCCGGIFVLGDSDILNVIDSSFLFNTGDNSGGGGAIGSNGTVNVANSTFSNNQTNENGGAMVTAGSTYLTNVTIVDNTADTDSDGGEGGALAALVNTITIKSSIIADNVDASAGAEYPDIFGQITSSGYNVVGSVGLLNFTTNGVGDYYGDPNGTTTPGAGATESASPIDPALSFSTGWPPYYRLQGGSPAVELIPPGSCTYISSGGNPLYNAGDPVTADQRGMARPQGANCDTGAYEAQNDVQLVKTADDVGPEAGQTIDYLIIVENSDALAVTGATLTDTLPAEVAIAGPITINPPAAGTVGTPPTIVTNLTVQGNSSVTVTIPVKVANGLSGGTVITNAAGVSGGNVITPTSTAGIVVVDECEAQIDGNGTIFSNVQAAVDSASDGDLIKVAGYCAGVELRGGTEQTAYVDKNLEIEGGHPFGFGSPPDPDLYPTTLDAARGGRVFYISTTLDVAIRHMTATGGRIDDPGGGVFVESGDVTMSDVQVVRNETIGGVPDGAGIHNNGVLTLTNSIVNRNDSTDRGGGIENSANGTMTIVDSSINYNVARDDGGAIENNGTLSLWNSDLSYNTIITGSDDDGGAIYNTSATLAVYSSTLTHNFADDDGGAIRHNGTMTIVNTLISDNDSGYSDPGNTDTDIGGGVYVLGGTAVISGTTIARNSARNEGGGIVQTGGDVVLVNSTVSLNEAEGYGGGLYGGGSSTMTVTHGTIAGNNSGTMGGGVVVSDTNTILLANTIVAGNTNAGSTPSDCAGSGTLTSQGYNLVGTGSSCPTVATDITANPATVFSTVLEPTLDDNGGATPTHALIFGGPAIDVVPPAQCPVDTDQRGVTRPVGPACDVGAFEYTNQAPTAVPDNYATGDDTPLTVTAPGVLGNDTDPEVDSLTAVLDTGPAEGMLVFNANGSFTYTPVLGAIGDMTFTYHATDGTNNSNPATVTIAVTQTEFLIYLPVINR